MAPVKQLVTPLNPAQLAQPSPSVPLATDGGKTSYGQWIDNTIADLEAAGWKRSGVDSRNLPKFEEPDFDKSVKFERVALPTRDGEPIHIKQIIVPRSPWDYTLEEAADIKRRRDLDAAKKEQQ